MRTKTQRDLFSHLAGTFVLYADSTFLNGAGIDGGAEDKNTVTPKIMRIRQGQRVLQLPYVSAQAWRRWLRNTTNEENAWEPSELQAIGTSAKKKEAAKSDEAGNEKGNTNKISTNCNPIDYPEDDLFGYMRAGAKGEESIQRTSPFRSSFLRAIPGTAELNRDEAFVHLKEGTPLPYTTRFYSAHLQAIFGLDIARLGRFHNTGSKQELEKALIDQSNAKLDLLSKNKKEEWYELKDKSIRWKRTQGVLRGLVRLRGGAKMAAFANDVTPKVLIFAALKSGNLPFNDLFAMTSEGFTLQLPLLEQILNDYKEQFRSPIYLGYREGFFANQQEIKSFSVSGLELIQGSPVEVVESFCKLLQEDEAEG